MGSELEKNRVAEYVRIHSRIWNGKTEQILSKHQLAFLYYFLNIYIILLS